MKSPTLQSMESTRRPAHGVACAECPNSVWFTTSSEVKCYCRVMFLLTWNSTEPKEVITSCDGPQIGQN